MSRGAAQPSHKVGVPKQEIKLGEKVDGLDKLREDLETDLLKQKGPIDIERKVMVDILLNEKDRLDSMIK